jgi:deoxycytidylate deaminase
MESHTFEYHLLYRLVEKLKIRDIGRYQFNVGSIITDKKGQILSYGFNSYTKTHPRQYLYNRNIRSGRIYLHAEIDSIIRCSTIDSAAHTMIIARYGKDTRLHLAKPCLGCFKAIQESGLKHVYYTDEEENLVLLDTEN